MLTTLRFALRRLTARPGYAALMIVTLGLGIGASTAVFSVVDETLLRFAPFAYADRLVDVIDFSRKSGGGGSSLTPEKIVGWQAQPAVFERFEGYSSLQFDVTGEAEPERLGGVFVSTGLFPMLGIQPRLGRGFVEGEGRPGADHVALISDGLWRRRFGADPSALGGTIVLNNERYTILGVMPRRFQLLRDEAAVWVPLDLRAAAPNMQVGRFWGLGRLPSGVTVKQAQQRADALATGMQQATPLARSWDLRLMPKRVADVNATMRTALRVLLGAVGFVLLITCANVANLFLSQAAARQREMAVRAALGASRARLIREVLTDSVLLATCGGVLGVFLAAWGVQALLAAAPPNFIYRGTTTIEIDGRILAFAAALTLATGMLFGLVPAIRGSRPNLEETLRGSGHGAMGRTSFGRMPAALIVAEVAFSLVLLVGAALMMRTLVRLHAIDAGFDPNNLVTMHIDLPTDRYPNEAARSAFFADLSRRLLAIPTISGVAVAEGVPPDIGGISFGVPEPEGSPVRVDAQQQTIPESTVTPSYFSTLRIPLRAARIFSEHDDDDALIVNKTLADRYWPDGSAVGRRFRLGSTFPWRTIVGVVGNVEAHVGDSRAPLQMYHPWVIPPGAARGPVGGPRRRGYVWRVLIVRAEQPLAVLPVIKSQVWALDKNQPVDRIALGEDLYANAFGRQRFVLVLMSVFAAIALILAGAGIFAVLSQAVAQRTREIGVRVALGAAPADVFRLIVSRGMMLTVAGIALGLAGASALSRVLTSLLFEVSPYDPVSFAAVSGLLLAVACLACWLPTRRAMRVEPAVALRVE
jgi:putative ABC transport system permease protein